MAAPFLFAVVCGKKMSFAANPLQIVSIHNILLTAERIICTDVPKLIFRSGNPKEHEEGND